MDKIIAAYKHVSQNSTPIAGKILKSHEGSVTISSIWSQRNIERKINVNSQMTQVANLNTKEVMTFTSTDITSE